MARALEDGNFNELADARLEGNYNPQEMARMVTCAAASIRHSGRKRPKMSQVNQTYNPKIDFFCQIIITKDVLVFR